MKIIKSYSQGIKQAALQPKMIFVLWLINLIFGLIIYFQFSGLLSEAMGKSMTAEKLLKKFDFNFLFESIIHHGESFHAVFSVTFVLLIVYFFVSIFLLGGILFSLIQSEKLSSVEDKKEGFVSMFFQGGGKFYGRFFRLCIYSLILWIAFIIIIFLLNIVRRALTSNGENERLSFYLILIQIGIGLFLLNLIRMILDYSRIKIAAEDSRKVFRSFFLAIKFVFKNLGKTLVLYYLLALTGVLLFCVYWALKSLIPVYSLIPILIGFVIGQIFIASRGWVKIAFQAGQLKFYKADLL